GTTIQLQLPLTLAIIPSIVVGVGSQRFAIPQVSVEEFVWVRSTDVKELIERFHGQDVLRLRGSLLPLVRLSQVLGIEETIVDPDTLQVTLERRQRISDRRSSDDSGDRTDHGHDRLRPDRRTNWRGDYNVV